MAPPLRPKSSCGRDERPPPGLTRITVSRGNIGRNRVDGNPVSLPAIVLDRGDHTAYADRVQILDHHGNIVAEIVQATDPNANPAVWIQTANVVIATVDGRPTQTTRREP